MDIGNLLSDDGVVAEVPFGDASVTIRYVPRDRLVDIVRKATTIRFNPKTHVREERVDPAKSNRLLGEAAVMGWSGITSGGEDVPFTPETRDHLMTVWGEFVTFVNEVCTDLDRLVSSGREEAKKN